MASEGVSRLLGEFDAEKFDPEVVIVDSLRRVLVGSENDAEAVGALWRNVAPLVAERTLIILHDMKKPNPQGGNDPRHRASGSTDLIAGVDVTNAITRKSGDVLLVECTKARHMSEPEPFAVSLYDDDADGPIVVRYEGTKEDVAVA